MEIPLKLQAVFEEPLEDWITGPVGMEISHCPGQGWELLSCGGWLQPYLPGRSPQSRA